MKQLIIVGIIALLLLPVVLMAQFTYLSDEEYKDLKRSERIRYSENLEREYLELQQRKADGIVINEQYLADIAALRARIASVDSEYDVVYNRILVGLGITADDVAAARLRLEEYNRQVDNWNRLSDTELWNSAKAIRQTINEYEEFKTTNVAKAPDFRTDIVELNRKVVNLEANLDRVRPKYYEDSYTVVKDDYLAKIAGYSFIYDDSAKWGIIYRANRDQIKDPNLIYVDQVLKIPRGLPDTWKVYQGESLWRIASYPEVYGKGLEWPKIYRENQDQISDPDIIHPDQIFRIPRD